MFSAMPQASIAELPEHNTVKLCLMAPTDATEKRDSVTELTDYCLVITANTRNRKNPRKRVKVIKLMLSEMVNGVNFELLPNMEMLTFFP